MSKKASKVLMESKDSLMVAVVNYLVDIQFPGQRMKWYAEVDRVVMSALGGNFNASIEVGGTGAGAQINLTNAQVVEIMGFLESRWVGGEPPFRKRLDGFAAFTIEGNSVTALDRAGESGGDQQYTQFLDTNPQVHASTGDAPDNFINDFMKALLGIEPAFERMMGIVTSSTMPVTECSIYAMTMNRSLGFMLEGDLYVGAGGITGDKVMVALMAACRNWWTASTGNGNSRLDTFLMRAIMESGSSAMPGPVVLTFTATNVKVHNRTYEFAKWPEGTAPEPGKMPLGGL